MIIDARKPPYVNLTMMRGDTETFSITLRDTKGQPVDFKDGDKIYFTVKTRAMREEKAVQKVIEEYNKNLALIEIEAEDTRELEPGNYVYDIQLTRADGQVKTLIHKSSFTILEDVTHE